jgi:type II secretory pathway pseudopilin PulG
MLHEKGYSLVEILISIGVFAVILYAATAVFTVAQETARIGNIKSKALFYMDDYIEKLKNIRRNDWDTLVVGRYIITESGGNVSLVDIVPGNEEVIQGYTRHLEIEDVYRDTNGNILDAPGIVDPSTKKITVTVSWGGIQNGTLSESMYFTRYMDNLSWIQTTEADFNAGTNSGTTVINNAGGEIVLGAGGSGSWCEPELTIAGLDLPRQGVANAITAIEGRAFAGTGENASGESFVNIGIGTSNPPTASIIGVMNGYKTNDVFGEENYGYIATDTNNAEFVVVDINSLPYTEEGKFDIPGSTDATSIFIYGVTGYVTTTSSRLYNINLTNKALPSAIGMDADGVALSGIGNSVYVNGGAYAYVATSGTSQFQIVDVNDPTNLTVVGSLSLPGGQGRDVVVNSSGTRAYVITAGSASQREFFIINIEYKDNPTLVSGGNYDTDGMDPKALEIVPGGRAVIVGVGGIEYQVISVINESNPASCGPGLNIDSGIFDSASVLESDNDAFTYILTGDANQEMRIIQGGPGGDYASSGVFESQTLDSTFNSTGFNRFAVSEIEPIGTHIDYQVAAKEPSGADCSTTTFDIFDFVGPDGTSASFFAGGDSIPTNNDESGYENPSQCFRFRAYLDNGSEYSQTPMFEDFTLNYSP